MAAQLEAAQKNKVHIEILLRNDATGNTSKIRDLLREKSSSVKEFVTRKAKEKLSRSFTKAYLYRTYTSFGVTPWLTALVLIIRSKYHLNVTETAIAQGIAEFIVKPFTYTFFDWGFAHVKWGYVNGSNKKDYNTKS